MTDDPAPPRFDDRMSDSDTLIWNIEQNPLLRSTITAVSFLDTMPDRGRLQRRIDRATRRIPRLRQRVVGNPLSIAPPRWEVDPHFNLSYHLRWAHLDGSGSRSEVYELTEPIAMQGFDRARPLWEFTLVDGLADGGAALIMKVHHAVTDGVGAVMLMLEIFSLSADDSVDDLDMPDAPPVDVLSPAERTRHAIDHELRRLVSGLTDAAEALSAVDRGTNLGASALKALDTLGSVGRMARPAPTPLSTLMTDRSLGVHLDAMQLPVEGLKRAAATADVKLNAAFLAGAARGMRRFHRAQGHPVTHLRLGMPVSSRGGIDADRAGNQFTPMRFPVPVDLDDPIEHMQTLDRLTRAQRHEPGLRLVEPAAAALRRLPASVTTPLFTAALSGIDFLASNVPGVGFPVYLEGSEITAIVPFGPLSGAAANLTLLSYADNVDIGINVDPAAVGDIDLLTASLRDSFDELLRLG